MSRESHVRFGVGGWVEVLSATRPVVDNRWSARLGRRRTWLLSQQALMIGIMSALAFLPQASMTYLQFALLALASLCSATQDIATDGLAAERLKDTHLSNANALSVGGMAAGFLAGSGGVLVAVDVSDYRLGVLLTVLLLVLTVIPTLLWREEPYTRTIPSTRANLFDALRRPNAFILLLLSLLFASTHSMDGALSKLYLVDRGWSLSSIGVLDAVNMGSMALLGCALAAWTMARFGAWICVMAGLTLLLVSAIFWLAFSYAAAPVSFPLVTAVKLMGGAGMGLATSAMFTIAMRFAAGANQTGTDVTIFKSANALGEIASASGATAVAATGGFSAGFGLAAFTALVTLVLAKVASRSFADRPMRGDAA